MDSDIFSTSRDFVRCCTCECSCSLVAKTSGVWIRSVKRKYEEFEDGDRFFLPRLDLYSNARILVENECIALREALSNQTKAIRGLYAELEEERNAASSAANEAMSMILRLQREKAEIQMDARQFKCFAEEKMAHDQQELLALEDMLYKREQLVQALTCEVQAYKHRIMSYGIEEEVEGERSWFSRNPSMVEIDAQFDISECDYPPLRCKVNEIQYPVEGDSDVADIEKYPSVESLRERQCLKRLERTISQLERNSCYSQLDCDSPGGKSVVEKMIIGQSPRRPSHHRKVFADGFGSPLVTAKEIRPTFFTDSPRSIISFKECVNVDSASELRDDMSDRVYTIDAIHNGVSQDGVGAVKAGEKFGEDYATTPRELLNHPDIHDPDIRKLYTRLQALEVDKESLRQTILSMRTDEAQLLLLKEIAQHLSKEMGPESQIPVQKTSFVGAFSFMSVFKWIVPFVFWKKRAHHSKYMYGLSANNMGLLMLVDKGPRAREWRCLTSAQV